MTKKMVLPKSKLGTTAKLLKNNTELMGTSQRPQPGGL